MKAIIIAAGTGTRLGFHTTKCLVKLNGETILEKQIRNLKKCGIEDVYLVIGFQAPNVRRFCEEKQLSVNLIYNPNFRGLNNTYSLILALREALGEFVLISGDVIFDWRMLRKLLKCKADICIVGQRSFKMGKFTPKGRELLDEELNRKNWEQAGLRYLMAKLDVVWLTARYYCFDVDYPKHYIKACEIVAKENRDKKPN